MFHVNIKWPNHLVLMQYYRSNSFSELWVIHLLDDENE
jgi:hypothetical protein